MRRFGEEKVHDGDGPGEEGRKEIKREDKQEGRCWGQGEKDVRGLVFGEIFCFSFFFFCFDAYEMFRLLSSSRGSQNNKTLNCNNNERASRNYLILLKRKKKEAVRFFSNRTLLL